MEQKIDEIRKDILEIKLDLRDHMRRTRQNEEMIDIMKKDVDPIKVAFFAIKWMIAASVPLAAFATAYLKFFE